MAAQLDMLSPAVSPLDMVNQHAEKFPDDFKKWLGENPHVWDAFVVQAKLIVRRGFQHYSARTIVHVLRHHSALAESGPVYKINDHASPYLARLFDLIYPEHAGLWEYRETNVEKGQA